MTIHAHALENFSCEDAIRCGTVVALPREDAFKTFRHDIFLWLPREFTWSGAAIENLFFEGRRGGMVWERGPGGFRMDMARVLRFVWPERMVLRWHVGPNRMPEPDPEKASEVEIRFIAAGADRTRVELEHRGFSRHGQGAQTYRARMGSGWPRILKSFADHCGPEPDGMRLPATLGGAFALAAAPHDGQEAKPFSVVTIRMRFDMAIVGLDHGRAGPATLDEIISGSPNGTPAIDENEISRRPSADELPGARYRAREIAAIARTPERRDTAAIVAARPATAIRQHTGDRP